jgi:hypothetical protein
MRLRYRIGYYMIGLTMGLFVVAAIWSGKDARCNYFPNARTLSNFRSKAFEFSDHAKQQLNEGWVDSLDIVNTLKYGDVDFDQSNIQMKGGGKRYIVEGKTTKDLPITLEIINYEKRAILKDITRNK